MSARRPPIAVCIAVVATALVLVLPLVATPDRTFAAPGRALDVRVLLVGAIALAAVSALGSTSPRRDRQLLTTAIVLLGLTAALVIRLIAPTGAILLAIAIAGLLWQRRALARTAS